MPENISFPFNKYVIHPKEIKGNSLVTEKLLARILMASLSLGNIDALVGLNYCSAVRHVHIVAGYASEEQYLRLFFFPLTVQKYSTLSIRSGFFNI